MSSPLQVTWENAPLKPSLLRLADVYGVNIFVDRRVDPDQPLHLSLDVPTFRQGLSELAEQLDLQVGVIGSVIYLGPRPTTAKLATLIEINRERMRQMPAERRREWRRPQQATWPRLSEPKNLILSWSEIANVSIRDAERIPHDLWDAGKLPSLALLERLTLLLAGFDLTLRLESDGSATIVSIPAVVSIEKNYPISDEQKSRLTEIRERIAEAEIKVLGRHMRVAATSEQHAIVKQWLRGETGSESPTTLGEQRYTLKVENQPVAGVLQALCQRMQLQLDLSRLSENQASVLISLNVKNVTRNALLQETVSQAGLSCRIESSQLVILPPPSSPQ